MNTKVLIPIFISAILVLILHLIAIAEHLYWKYWWYDNIVHFLGGITISLVVLFYLERFQFLKNTSELGYMGFGCLGALIVSLLWEFFEYSAGVSFVTANSFVLDTVLDISTGFIGAWCASMYAYAMRKTQ
jgi:L-cystine uptake protein TcyP (sodium:dicarboxylate symporter family)